MTKKSKDTETVVSVVGPGSMMDRSLISGLDD